MGVRGVLGCWDLYQSKAHPRLPHISQYKVLLYLTPFGRTLNREFWGSPMDRPVIAVVAAHRRRQKSMGETIAAEASFGVHQRRLGVAGVSQCVVTRLD